MRKTFFCILVSCLAATTAFGQAVNGTFTGTVSDATGAVLPSVMITVTNNATGVVSTTISNEAGAYYIPGLLPGVYNLSAELPGFQKETLSNATLGNAITVRLNFSLKVASTAQSVEVTVSADTVLSTSSPTIGQGLNEQKVRDLPLIGGNVLDLINVLGGVDNVVMTGVGNTAIGGANAFGREGTTLAGVSAQDTPVLRDGIIVNDLRWPGGINTNTVINPDLVGEVKLIVSPVDAELGRGNGAIQITTRSGTNQFRGAAVWNTQNTALNANSWQNNTQGLPPIWRNNNQGTFSVGGPIVKNKTFFYALYDMNLNRGRGISYDGVPTPCARNGVFRYFDNWNNGAVGTATSAGSFFAPATTQTVNPDGSPLTPTTNPDGSRYTGKLNYISVYGPVTFAGGAPNGDCSNGTVNGSWDPFRTKQDTTGIVSRSLAFMPAPNDFTTAGGGTVDGLNVASYRFLQHFRGADNLFSVGENTGNRYQINVKIDHNFSQKHRGNINVSYEHVSSDDVVAGLPGSPGSNNNYHIPKTVTAGFVSTLSPSLVNEAKFGWRYSGTQVVAPWDVPAEKDAINKFLPPLANGFQVLPDIYSTLGLCNPIAGVRAPPSNCTGGLTSTARDNTPLWTYGDTLSLTKGKHTLRYGGEIRFASSESIASTPGANFFGNTKLSAVVTGGTTPGAPLAQGGPTSITNSNPTMLGIGSADATNAQSLLNFLSGSLASIGNAFYLTSPTATKFSDYRDIGSVATNSIKQREFDLFFKDDFKVRKNLTLNLGLRYEWYGVPYSPNGLTVAPVGGGGAAFGISGRDFSGWMNPGARAGVTNLQFVGPGSPNAGTSAYANDNHNFGPAVGFAWSPTLFGEGKTTVRGGYQITYQGGGRFFTLEAPLTFPPGRTYFGVASSVDSTNYMDFTKLSAALPTPVPTAPMAPISITDRSQGISFFDPNYTSPYVQNLTLAVTRSINRHMTFDVRYVGTLARKLYSSIELNSPNFLYNGLGAEFDKIRAGQESPLLDKMLNGVNICAVGCPGAFGAIGTTFNGVPQTAAMQMRSSSTFNGNLALGNYNVVAGNLATLNYFQVGCPAAGAAGNCNLPPVDPNVVRGSALRANGNPENLIYTNPQFSSVSYLSNMGSSNYHSLQLEYTLRPTHGFSGTVNYTFSKNLGVPPNPYSAFGPSAGFTNPVNRHMDYTIVNNNHPHILRTNGTIELPIGPGKTFLSSSSGVFARAIENWKLGGIWTVSSGAWSSIAAQSNLYANGVPDVANAALLKELLGDSGLRWTTQAGPGQLQGSFFDPAKWTKVADPQCAAVTSLQSLNGFFRCSLTALGKVVPANTPGSVPLNDGSGNSGLIVLQNPRPGTQGNLGQNVLRGLAPWRFDANMSKAFKLSESKRLQFRFDAQNVLNHPQASAPSLDINSSFLQWGSIANGFAAAKTGGRAFQAQLRLEF